MNERIKELETQCWEDKSPEWAENIQMVFNIEKFAELLIKECSQIAKVAERTSDLGWYRIEQHFGIHT